MTARPRTGLSRLLPERAHRFLQARPELQRVVHNVNWLLADKVFDVLVGLTVGVLIARLLGPERYGMVRYLLALTALATTLSGLGQPNLTVRGLVDGRIPEGALLGTTLGLRTLASVVALGACVVLLPVMRSDSPALQPLLWSLAGARLLATPAFVQAYFQARVDSRALVIARVSVVTVFALAKVGVLLTGRSLGWFVMVLSLEIVAQAGALLAVYARRSGAGLGSWRYDRSTARELLRDGLPLMLTSLMTVVYLRMDQIMLGQLAGDVAVGIYGVAATVTTITYAVPGFVAWSVFPGMVKARKEDPERYRTGLQALSGVLLWLGLLATVVIGLTAGALIPLVFGQAYAESARVLSLQSWGLIFFFSGSVAHKHLIAEGAGGRLLAMTSIGAFTNLAANLWLIPTHGAMGAAAATVMSFSLSHCLSAALFAQSRFLLRAQLRALWLPGLLRDVRQLR